MLIDPHGGITEEDLAILDQARLAAEKAIVVLTKADLDSGGEIEFSLEGENCPPVVSLSAKTGEGLEKLERTVGTLFPQREENWGELLTNARQAEAAGRALEAVSSAQSALTAGMPGGRGFLRCGGGPGRAWRPYRPVGAGGCDRPHLFAFLRGK